MRIGHAPPALIADYAAGTLSPGMSLLVASHLTYCPTCRDKVARLESLCGALMVEAKAVNLTSRCLGKALERIASGEATEPPSVRTSDLLPRPLCQTLAVRFCDLRWRQATPGLSTCRVEGFPEEHVELVRATSGARLRGEGPGEAEAALVLAGRISDGSRTYDRGDLAFAPAGRPPQAIGQETCLCLVVQPKPG